MGQVNVNSGDGGGEPAGSSGAGFILGIIIAIIVIAVLVYVLWSGRIEVDAPAEQQRDAEQHEIGRAHV